MIDQLRAWRALSDPMSEAVRAVDGSEHGGAWFPVDVAAAAMRFQLLQRAGVPASAVSVTGEANEMRLYDYWRSSAAYRVRIALNLKGLAYEPVSIDLRAGAQRSAAFLGRNPNGLVPCLEDGDVFLDQSLAILEYLEERHPDPPLLPDAPEARAAARSIALAVACDIHPLNNTRVLQYLERELEVGEGARLAWYRHWIALGLGALEARLSKTAGRFCVGDRPSFADVCLVPQMYNARRYECDIKPYPSLRRIDEHCRALEPFARAAPERQPDAAT